jgi:hypothetical protein
METLAGVFQDYGLAHLTHSLMNHHNSANFVISIVIRVVYVPDQITASVMISNVEIVLITLLIQIVAHVDF